MKRWCLSGYVFLAVVAALLLSVAVGAQDTCEGANASRDVGLYEDALNAYAELLKNDTYRDCALAGIRELQDAQAKKHYELGQAYEDAKQYDLAYAEYKKALEINQTLACAQSGINESRQKKAEESYRLGIAYEKAKEYKSARDAYINALGIDPTFNKSYEALNQVSNRLFTEVRTLAGMGLYAEAGERLKKVVEENPGIDVPKNLTYLFGDKIFFWRLPWWIRPLGELVLALLIVFLVVRRIYNLRKPRLDIEDFDKGATNLDIGKGLAAMVEVSFKQIGESGAHGSRPSLIDGPIEKFEIPADVKSVHPYIKIMTQLFEWVFRPDVYTLSGYLQKPGGDLGAGLTLLLVRKNKGEIIANETIWQKDFDPAITPQEEKDPAPYYRLAEPAAIWTIFHDELPFKKKLTLLGTRDWLSFAYFRAGVRWAREDRKDKAQKLYLEALNQDTDNRGAWFNLGALDTEAEEYERAIKRLQMAREKYLFCWSKIPRNVSMGDIPGDDSRKLRRFLVDDRGILWAENAEIIRSRNDKTISIRENGYSAEIKLDRMEEKAVLKIRDGRSPDLKVEMENGEPNIYAHFLKEPVWYKATYQLAVTYHYCSMQKQAEDEAENLVATIQEAIKILQKKEDKALKDFLESFKPMAAIMYAGILVGTNREGGPKLQVNIIDSDSTKLSYEIITSEGGNGDRIDPDTTKLTYRSHYNLACYYSETSNNKKALEHLEYALERGGNIVQWAKNDPSLKRLREDKKGDFDKLIKKYSAPITPSADLLPLAGLRLIGATYAKQLKEQGIVSYDDLIRKAKDCEARKALAEKLCINDKFLQRWALLADMMRIVGIDTQYANLLEAAGVRSLDDLKVSDSHELTKLLHQVNSAQSLVKQLPPEETVQQWVRDAQETTKPIVSD